MNFVQDCLNRKMTLRDVATKYNISIDEVFDRYEQERTKYSKEELGAIMNDVYYKQV